MIPAALSAPEARHIVYGRSFRVTREFPHTAEGLAQANAYMLENEGEGVIAVEHGLRIILASIHDKGEPVGGLRLLAGLF